MPASVPTWRDRLMGRAVLFLVVFPAFSLAADPPFYPDKQKLLVWRDDEGKEHPVKTPADWEKRRAHILAGMQLAMGPLPDASRKVALDIKETEVFKTEKCHRIKLTFAVEEGDRVPAYLFLPRGAKGKVPAILC